MIHFRVRAQDLNPGQIKLLKSRAPVVLMSGGFGSGKTTALGPKLLQLKAENPKTPGIIISQTYKSLWATTMRRIMATLRMSMPRHALPRVVDKTGECYLDFGDGVPIFLRSATNPDAVDGLDTGWALGDEARHWPHSTYEVLLGRCRQKCALPQIALASTPEMNWLAQEFDSGVTDRELICAPTLENAHNLSPNYIPNLRLSYSKRLQKAVLEGLFTILEGAVYEALDPDFWNSEWVTSHKYDPHLETYLSVDPGYRKSSWMFFQEVRPLTWVLFDQMQLDNTSDWAAVERVNAKGYGIDEIWTDPAADATQSTIGLDTIALLRSINVRRRSAIRYITGAFQNIAFGVDKMRVLFGDPEVGLPIRLKVARSMKRKEMGQQRGFVRSHLSYRYPELKDGRAVSNIPLKDGVFDHDSDCARYWGVGMFATKPGLRRLIMDKQLKSLLNQGGGWKTAA